MIHRYWTTGGDDTSPPLEPWLRDRIRHVYGEEPTDWTDASLDPDIRLLADECADGVQYRDRLRHRSNIVRLALLRKYGGIWMDYDFIPIMDMSGLITPALAAHDGGWACNCFMSFPAHHPMLDVALACATRHNDEWASEHVSGERMLEMLSRDYDVNKLLLPFDFDGRANKGSMMWGVHVFQGRRR